MKLYIAIFVCWAICMCMNHRVYKVRIYRLQALDYIFDQPCGTIDRISAQAERWEEFNKSSFNRQILQFHKWKFKHFFPNIHNEVVANGLSSDKRKTDESQKEVG